MRNAAAFGIDAGCGMRVPANPDASWAAVRACAEKVLIGLAHFDKSKLNKTERQVFESDEQKLLKGLKSFDKSTLRKTETKESKLELSTHDKLLLELQHVKPVRASVRASVRACVRACVRSCERCGVRAAGHTGWRAVRWLANWPP